MYQLLALLILAVTVLILNKMIARVIRKVLVKTYGVALPGTKETLSSNFTYQFLRVTLIIASVGIVIGASTIILVEMSGTN